MIYAGFSLGTELQESLGLSSSVSPKMKIKGATSKDE